MKYNELVDWLFGRSKMCPQVGMANRDKRAIFWLPGKSMPNYERIQKNWETAPLKGCSQVAYEKIFSPMAGQRCEIVHVDLDIDQDDNPETDLTAIHYPGASMVRTSVSGKGVHVLYRLAEPIACTHETANQIIKAITAPLVEALGTIKVCKSDKRLFWLWGGKNEIISRDDCAFLTPAISPIVTQSITKSAESGEGLSVCPSIREWATKLGLIFIRKSNPIYIGSVLLLLRSLGEKVETKSSCRGNGQMNGYLDVTEYSISLFSFADGHSIWSWTDVEALLGGAK